MSFRASDLDNATVGRSIRPLTLNRKSALFAGFDNGGDNWAVIATLIECCKLNAINSHNGLTGTLSKVAEGHTADAVVNSCPGPPGLRTSLTVFRAVPTRRSL